MPDSSQPTAGTGPTECFTDVPLVCHTRRVPRGSAWLLSKWARSVWGRSLMHTHSDRSAAICTCLEYVLACATAPSLTDHRDSVETSHARNFNQVLQPVCVQALGNTA